MPRDEFFGNASSARAVVSFQDENALSRLGHISSGYETMMAGAHKYNVKCLRHAVPLATPIDDSRPIILFVHPQQKSLLEIHSIGADDGSMEARPPRFFCASAPLTQRTALAASAYASSAQMPGILITAFGNYY